MLRFCLCLVFVLLSAGAAAREVKMSSPHGGGCSEQPAAGVKKAPATATPATAPAAETRIKPSVHSDAPSRLSSPRWHSFLPGMFR
jgi:hypothetical protein